MKIICADVLVLLTTLAAACGGTLEFEEGLEQGGEPVGVDKAALLYGNALNPNALSPSALGLTTLSPNVLSPTALTPSKLDSIALAAIQATGPEGALSRQLLRYLVGCALSASQSFDFSWIDSGGTVRAESYHGELGLAPLWNNEPLSDDGDQRWVSACLASRVNWYGVTVMLSLRAAHAPLSFLSSQEAATYTRVEGAFWGNLFVATPYVRSCYTQANVDHSRQSMRDCAAGHLETDPTTSVQTVRQCGILHIVGACDAVCDPLVLPGSYYPKCTNDPLGAFGKMPQVITTVLP
jgi:hypothetical protein